MKTINVTVVRIYYTEGDSDLKILLARLHDEHQVRGVTVFRGIAGFGVSGKLHSSSLLDLSLDLPQVIEFFDEPDKIATILDELADLFKPGHVLSWNAEVSA